ncbi:MAG: hypothetical protein ABFD91_00810 [Anaerohalosphaeraceae bacterium]
MNKIFTICAIMALAIVPAMAAYTVDLGTDAGEAGVTLTGWSGQMAPASGYGTPDAGSLDGAFRLVWEPGSDASSNTASITFGTAIDSVNIRFLDGFADDSFDINIYGDGSLWGTVSAPPSTTEDWVWSGVYSGTAGKTLTLTVTGVEWDGFNTYGQLAVDRLDVTFVPAPGAILLGAMGTGLVGWLRRRRSL